LIAIIGGGASGIMCAILLARKGKKVSLFEKNNKLGKKILATGNGRCNITNKNISQNRYYSSNKKFISNILVSFKEVEDFFNSIGLEIIQKDEGRCYPLSLQASSVVDLLEYEAKNLGVDIFCDFGVDDINYKNDYFYINKKIKAKTLIIATGNVSAPSLGGCDDGIKFAKYFKHNIINSFASLVQLTSDMIGLKKISGVRIYSEVNFMDKKIKGDILFTNYGISGLAILDISRFVLEKLQYSNSEIIYIDLMPNTNMKELKELLIKYIQKKENKKIDLCLHGIINKKIIPLILNPLNLYDKKSHQIQIKEITKIANRIKNLPFQVNGSKGYKYAEVATGGVDTKQINPKTLESYKQKRLYFMGEVLDVDGDRGGFNLHFAWSCALRVAKSL
jgi:predicted Rossmann fold flavoprotein